MVYRLDSFAENAANPITGLPYDASWIILILTDSDEYTQFAGSRNGCAYTVKISRTLYRGWQIAAGDFIAFHEASGKNILLILSESELLSVQSAYAGRAYNEAFLRENEPRFLIHSTSMESFRQIQKDGMLKCWNRLKAEHAVSETSPIGRTLGDPADFSNYIMFGDGVTGEIVVSSRQKSAVCMDIDMPYQSGARLYFDAERMAKDSLLHRDGSHIKVKDTLPLYPYLLFTATWDTIGLESRISTPRIFAKQADRAFLNFIQCGAGAFCTLP